MEKTNNNPKTNNAMNNNTIVINSAREHAEFNVKLLLGIINLPVTFKVKDNTYKVWKMADGRYALQYSDCPFLLPYHRLINLLDNLYEMDWTDWYKEVEKELAKLQ